MVCRKSRAVIDRYQISINVKQSAVMSTMTVTYGQWSIAVQQAGLSSFSHMVNMEIATGLSAKSVIAWLYAATSKHSVNGVERIVDRIFQYEHHYGMGERASVLGVRTSVGSNSRKHPTYRGRDANRSVR